MTYYICITIGQADFLPDVQEYYSAGSKAELREIVRSATEDFKAASEVKPYLHAFRCPSSSYETNWSQRLCIARNSDTVLDVIGITQDDYERETDGEY